MTVGGQTQDWALMTKSDMTFAKEETTITDEA